MPKALVNGVQLTYRQTGSGPDLVLIHGLGANQAFWNLDLVTALAADFRVTTFDLRGHGYSGVPATGYQPAETAIDLSGLLDRLGIDHVHCVGHSYGGLVAFRLAFAQPDRVLTLTIADTRVRSLQPDQALTETPAWPWFRELLARQGVVMDDNEPEMGFMLFEALASPQWERARDRAAVTSTYLPFGRAGSRSARRWLQLLSATSMKSDYRTGADISLAELAKIRQPTLAVYGENSPNRRTGQRLQHLLASCKTVIAPGANHFHPATHPEFFRDAAREFLAAHAAATAPEKGS